MLYIIDGTGAMSEDDYAADMNRGFCSKLNKQNGPNAQYWRGPTLFGAETWSIGDEVFNKILNDKPSKIVLVGHSRGGAACVYVARKLKTEGINVQGMLLLDAVRRAISSPMTYFETFASGSALLVGGLATQNPSLLSTGMDVLKISTNGIAQDFNQGGNQAIDTIPSNVYRALHLIREEKFSFYFAKTLAQAQQALVDSPSSKGSPTERLKPKNALERAKLQSEVAKLQEFHENLRDACRFECKIAGRKTSFSFGNTALRAEPGCKLTMVYFPATHGAMGGAPLNTYDYISDFGYAERIETQEVLSMLAVQSRINMFLKEIGEGETSVAVSYVPACMYSDDDMTRPAQQLAIKK